MRECNSDVLHHVVTVMWQKFVSHDASLPSTNPLPWVHGKVKCPSDVKVITENIKSVFFFFAYSYKYCEFGYTTLRILFFTPTFNKELCDFACSPGLIENQWTCASLAIAVKMNGNVNSILQVLKTSLREAEKNNYSAY